MKALANRRRSIEFQMGESGSYYRRVDQFKSANLYFKLQFEMCKSLRMVDLNTNLLLVTHKLHDT